VVPGADVGPLAAAREGGAARATVWPSPVAFALPSADFPESKSGSATAGERRTAGGEGSGGNVSLDEVAIAVAK
jgi:hypothetical protein